VKQPVPVLVGVGEGVALAVDVVESDGVEEGDAAALREGVGEAVALGEGHDKRRTAWLSCSTT